MKNLKTYFDSESGRFRRDGRDFIPIGFNYWPSSSGVHCWKEFNLEEWKQDFREIAARDFNALRIFLLWEDFQPSEDRIDETMLKKLRRVCKCAADHGLVLTVTILQGFMSGTIFYPAWLNGRHMINDYSVIEAEKRLCRQVAETLADLENIFAYDLGNELDAILGDVTSETIRHWSATLRREIQAVSPEIPVTHGTSNNPLYAENPWSFTAQELDFLCVHGYPVFRNPLPVEDFRSPRAGTVFAGMVSLAGCDGAVMRQEFGLAIGGDSPAMADFLLESQLAAFGAGANGFLFWCWRDFSCRNNPYCRDPFESALGYVDVAGRPKQFAAGLDRVRDFLEQYGQYRPAPCRAGIYRPEAFKTLPATADAALAAAYEALTLNGIAAEFTAKIEQYELLVCPVTRFNLEEIDSLRNFTDRGGKLLILALCPRNCSGSWEQLTGSRQTGFRRTTEPVELRLGSAAIPGVTVYGTLPEMAPISPECRIISRDGDFPTILATGNRIVQVIPEPLADGPSDTLPGRLALFRELLGYLNFHWELNLPDAEMVEMREFHSPEGKSMRLFLNHSADRRAFPWKKKLITLEPKAFEVVK